MHQRLSDGEGREGGDEERCRRGDTDVAFSGPIGRVSAACAYLAEVSSCSNSYVAASSTAGMKRLLERAPRITIMFAQTTARDIRPQTYPTILLYGRSHFIASKDAMRFSKARASVPAIPST